EMPENTTETQPTMAPKQEKWLTAFVDKKAAAQKQVDKATQKQQVLLEVSLSLESDADDIQKGMDFKVLINDKTVMNKVKRLLHVKDTMSSMNKKHDANKEIDTVHDLADLESLTPEQRKQVDAAMAKIAKMTEKMRDAVDEDGNPLFTDADIADEIWTPLVRQGLIPENVVPDKHSQVSKTFAGANAAYVERLEKYTAGLDEHDGLLKKLGLAQDMIGKVGDLADSIVEAAGGPKIAGDIVKLISIGGQGLTGLAAQIIKKDDAQSILETIGGIASDTCSTVLPKDIGDIVSASITTGLKGTAILQKVVEGDGDGVVDVLGELIESSLTLAGKVNGDDRLEDIGGYVKNAIQALPEAKDFIKAAVAKDPKKMKAALEKLVERGIDMAGDEIKSRINDETGGGVDLDGDGEDDDSPEAAAFKEIFDTSKEAITQAREILKDEKASPEEKRKAAEELKKHLEQLSEAQQAQEEVRREEREFESMLLHGFSDAIDSADATAQEAEEALSKIEPMILKLKKDQMIFELVDKLSSLPITVAAQFFPPASIALDFKKFSVEAAKAVLHAKELLKWLDNVGDARNAVSVQAEAMLNRVGMEDRQALEASMRATLHLVSAIGNLIATVGAHAAPAGAALAAAAKVGQASLEIASKIYTEAQMAAAWKTYKAAVKKPGDRKLARKALRDNPTLAKYAIAWGAISVGDPIAKKGLQSCGLTNKVLADKDTNVHNVVAYLETLYKEDPVLERAVIIPKKWYPGEPELTVRSWAAFVDAAEKKATPKLKAPKLGAVSGALETYTKAQDAFDGGKNDTTKEALVAACTILITSLNRFEAVGADGKPHEEMHEYVDQMVAFAELSIRAANDDKSEDEGEKLKAAE
ncbi:MAG TPA: hypothetical protein VL574_14945, partial [Stellaceae bacterium]|nr:hypothetical protein [Stellaceae bacterium]